MLAVVALALALPAGCGGTGHRTIRVLLVGDSNLRLVSGPLERAWARTAHAERTLVPVVHGVNGATACPDPASPIATGPALWVPVLTSTLSAGVKSRRRVDVVVVQLGTNDALNAPNAGSCLADYAGIAMAPIVDAIRSVDPKVRVVWVNQRTDYRDASLAAATRRVNAQLSAARARWKQLEVANFDRHFRDHPAWFYPGGTVAEVHLDAAGVREYVRWMTPIVQRAR